MTPPVAPELFDVLSQYAKAIELGKIKSTPLLGETSPALTFCENFYVQFFQNRLGCPIERINSEAKETAVRLRLEVREANGAVAVIQLITWFEKLCDIYPSLVALGYGTGTKTVFFDFHHDYLVTLLERASAWGQAENYAEIEQKAKAALSELKTALQVIPQ